MLLAKMAPDRGDEQRMTRRAQLQAAVARQDRLNAID
jgi:hypothetical protein